MKFDRFETHDEISLVWQYRKHKRWIARWTNDAFRHKLMELSVCTDCRSCKILSKKNVLRNQELHLTLCLLIVTPLCSWHRQRFLAKLQRHKKWRTLCFGTQHTHNLLPPATNYDENRTPLRCPLVSSEFLGHCCQHPVTDEGAQESNELVLLHVSSLQHRTNCRWLDPVGAHNMAEVTSNN
jgi:hypothetical protein